MCLQLVSQYSSKICLQLYKEGCASSKSVGSGSNYSLLRSFHIHLRSPANTETDHRKFCFHCLSTLLLFYGQFFDIIILNRFTSCLNSFHHRILSGFLIDLPDRILRHDSRTDSFSSLFIRMVFAAVYIVR